MEATQSLAFAKPIIYPGERLAGRCPLHEHMDNSSGARFIMLMTVTGDQRAARSPL